MYMAWTIKEQSPDAETKHGCVITSHDNRVLGVGYNGWPSAMPHELCPNTRPDKYDLVIHDAANAVYNCERKPVMGIAYVTGQCCLECCKILYQNGVIQIYQMDRHGSHLCTEHHEEIKKKMTNNLPFNIATVKPDFSHFYNMEQI